MSIVYNYFDFASAGMVNSSLDLDHFVTYLPSNQKCKIYTNIKRHCGDNDREFIINVDDGKITNPYSIEKINDYLEKNNSRSYFFEGLVSRGNGSYYLRWGS